MRTKIRIKREIKQKITKKIALSHNFQLHQFYFRHGVLEYFKLKLPYFHHLVEFGERLILVQDEPADSHVFIAFRQVEVERFVHFVYLKTCREQVLIVAQLLCNIVCGIVFVFYIAEYLLHYIF